MMDSLLQLNTLAYYYGSTGYGEGSSMGGGSMLGLILLGLTALISFAVQQNMQAKMKQYSQEPAPLTGAETAERILRENGITHVRVISTPGQLTDHYNPSDLTVNLSEMVYNQRSVAAMAVAAHECGHALQHAESYAWLQLRSSLVPMVGFGAKFGQIVLIAGLIMLSMGSGTTVAWIGLTLFATTTLFALITLPVEFDASRRALAWMQHSGVVSPNMQGEAKSALSWAAMTYVSAALSSIAMILYYAMMLLGRGNNRD
ncbi:MAG: zinc metallopeptidase [Akkermansia sp.]